MLIKQVIWLGLVFMFLSVLQLLFKTQWYYQFKKLRFIYLPFKVVTIVILVISMRVFVFEIYYIPTKSMENTLIAGDVILLNKLFLGPRMPRFYNEIPWVSLFNNLRQTDKKINKGIKWGNKRLRGVRSILRGNVLVFNLSKHNHKTMVKRCVGLPGELISIKNNKVYINNTPNDPLDIEKYNYRLYYNSVFEFSNIIDSLGISHSNLDHDSLDISLSYLDLMRLGACGAFEKFINLNYGFRLVNNHYKKGEKDNLPEFRIPYKGFELELTARNKKRYRKILSRYEGLEWNDTNKEYMYQGKIVEKYVFKNDYYFMMGDNRTESIDSRRWGALPEDLIVGIATNVIWNQNGLDNDNWKRIGKILL